MFYFLLLKLDVVFLPMSSALEARIQFAQDRQKRRESIQAYHRRMKALWEVGFPNYPPDVIAIWRFIDGLESPKVQDFLRATAPTTWEGLLEMSQTKQGSLEQGLILQHQVAQVEPQHVLDLRDKLEERRNALQEAKAEALQATRGPSGLTETGQTYAEVLADILKRKADESIQRNLIRPLPHQEQPPPPSRF
jgi:hypothetical protein